MLRIWRNLRHIKSYTDLIKRVSSSRLRGDWSDTGPNARPEAEGRPEESAVAAAGDAAGGGGEEAAARQGGEEEQQRQRQPAQELQESLHTQGHIYHRLSFS